MNTTATAARTFEDLTDSQAAEITAKVAKLNKIADKLGVAPMTVRLENPRYGLPRILSEDAAALVDVYGPQHFHTDICDVVVDGVEPKLPGGWTFVAALERTDSGRNLVHTNRGGFAADWVHAGQGCGHCGKAIARVHTCVIESEAGELLQVGRACLADFLGHTLSEASLWRIAEAADADDDEWFTAAGPAGYPLAIVLGLAADSVAAAGFVRSGWDNTERASTVNAVRHMLAERVTPSETGKAIAADIVGWLTTVDPAGSDYLLNLTSVAAGDTVTDRQMGLTVSAVSAWEREQAKRIERAAAPDPVDAPEGATEVVGVVSSIKARENYYTGGTEWKMTVADDRGFRVWCSLPAALDSAEVGDRVRFTVTLTRSGDDRSFAFGKRPRKAEVLPAA